MHHILRRCTSLLPLSLVCLAALLMARPAHGEASPTWSHAAHFPAGSPYELVVRDGHAYILNSWSRGDGVLVFDVRNPAEPRFVRGLPAGGYARGPGIIRGSTLYAASWFSVLLFDVAEPASAHLLRKLLLGFPNAEVSAMAADGGHLYVGSPASGLRIFDISEPESPVITAHHPDYGNVIELAASEDRLVIRTRGSGSVLATLQDGRITGESPLKLSGAVRLLGSALYETTRRELVVHDISDPQYSAVAARLADMRPLGMIAPDRLLAGVADANSARTAGPRLVVLDVSDPLAPRVLRELTLPQDVVFGPAAVEEGHLYMLERGRAILRIFDLPSDGSASTELGQAWLMRNAGHLAMHDDGPALLSYTEQAQAVLTLDPHNPQGRWLGAVRHAPLPRGAAYRVHDVHEAAAIHRIGTYLLTGDGLVDVSDARQLRIVHPMQRAAAGIAVKDGIAFLAQSDRVTLLDVSALPALKVRSVYKPAGDKPHAVGVVAGDGVAYVLRDEGAASRVEVLDVSDPARPALLGTCAIPPAITAALYRNYLYVPPVAGGGEGAPAMTILDVSDPADPRVAAAVPGLVQGGTYCIRVHNNQLVFTDSMHGITAADLTDPLEPKRLHTYLGPTDQGAAYTDFAFRDGKLYGLRFSQLDVWDLH